MRKGTISLFLGAVLIAAGAGLTGFNLWQSHNMGVNSEEVLHRMDELLPEPSERDTAIESPEEIDEDIAMPTIEIDGYRYIGKLIIYDLGYELPVMEELDLTRLSIAPCRFSGSVYKNDLIIGAHSAPAHFQKAKWLNVDSRVDFIDMDGNVYKYVLDSKETILPEEVDLLMDHTDHTWDLTLFTCTTDNLHRCVLRFSRIEE